MDQNYHFPRDSILPSFWANRIQDFVSSILTFRLEQATANSIRVPAGPEDEAVSIPIERRWRFVEVDVTRAHPGGAAGTYSVWVTAEENDIVNAPDPFTDNTNYAFALAITAEGVPPAGVPGSVDIWREVGSLEWDGAAITDVTQTYGVIPPEVTQAELDTVAALVAAHIADTAIDGGPHGLPALADGEGWLRVGAAMVAINLATQLEMDTALALKAPLASPVFTGDPRAPTPAAADDDTSIATTEWVRDLMEAEMAGKTFYIESDAGAGVTTGQTDPATSYTTVKKVDGTDVSFTITEAGAYEVYIQGGGDDTGGNGEAFAKAYRVSDNKTLLERGWHDAFGEPSSFGTGTANKVVWGSSQSQAEQPTRIVQLAVGDVIKFAIRADAGTIQLNRDSCHVRLRKVNATGGAQPT